MITSNENMSIIQDAVRFLEPYNATLLRITKTCATDDTYKVGTTYDIQFSEDGLLQLKNDIQSYNTASTAIMLLKNVMDNLP